MNSAPLWHRLSIEEYLAFEEHSDTKHEYVDGVLYAMVGGTDRHNLINGSMYAELRSAARGGPCRVFISDVKLQAANDAFYYPDIMMVCDPDDDDPLVKTQPVLLAEVLSPSTERVDRTDKLMAYRAIDCLQTYLIVHQDRRLVEWHQRAPSGGWQRIDVLERGRIPMPHLDLELTLDDIYMDVGLPTADSDDDV